MIQDRREGRRPVKHVPLRYIYDPRQPRGTARDINPGRLRIRLAPDRHADTREAVRRGDDIPRRVRI